MKDQSEQVKLTAIKMFENLGCLIRNKSLINHVYFDYENNNSVTLNVCNSEVCTLDSGTNFEIILSANEIGKIFNLIKNIVDDKKVPNQIETKDFIVKDTSYILDKFPIWFSIIKDVNDEPVFVTDIVYKDKIGNSFLKRETIFKIKDINEIRNAVNNIIKYSKKLESFNLELSSSYIEFSKIFSPKDYIELFIALGCKPSNMKIAYNSNLKYFYDINNPETVFNSVKELVSYLNLVNLYAKEIDY